MPMKRKLISIGLAAVALSLFLGAVSHVEQSAGEEGARQLERALRQAAVACYASEGIYPPDVDYMSKHYGVLVDEERFAVFYDNFADNLMPEILVLERGT